MIGRDPDNTLYVAGTRQQPFLKPFIEKAAARAPVKLVMGHDDPNAKGVEDWTRDSDHYAFCQAKIPCLYLGVEDFANHHKTTDDYETMTHAFYVRAVEAAAHTIRELDAGLDAIAAARAGGSGPAAAQALAAAETPIEIPVPGGKVAGTLMMPVPAAGQIPAAIIISGSGPTDRDGNSPLLGAKNNSLRMLAEALAAAGIASVRYDKRGVAGSVVKDLKEADLRFEDFVNDAAAWITLLRNDARFASVTVIGHSEGSAIGMLAARAARADAFVSIAGIARRPSDVLRDQLRPQLAASSELWDASERILKAVEAGQTSQPVPPALATLYRASVQPYLISWFAYTPSIEFARLRVPALLLQGTTDLQVGVPEAEALKAAKPDATLRVIDGMNHVLKAAPVDRAANIAAYTNPDLPLVAEVPAAIQAFVRGLRLPRQPTTARLSPRRVTSGVVDGARIAIEYGQLATRGRDIWGALVPWNRVWMPGADESTTITTSAPLTFGSLVVPAGDHTIYTLPAETGVTLILSSQIFQFHTEYRSERDLGRVPMTLARLDTPAERLAFEIRRREGGGVLALRWADREYTVPFTVTPAGR
jgi:pimeloyl-ACP methyl ester carboxylesterase